MSLGVCFITWAYKICICQLGSWAQIPRKKSCVLKELWEPSPLKQDSCFKTLHKIYRDFFSPLRLWKQPFQALDNRETKDTVAVPSIYSCLSLKPDVSHVFAHGNFCLSTGRGSGYPCPCCSWPPRSMSSHGAWQSSQFAAYGFFPSVFP